MRALKGEEVPPEIHSALNLALDFVFRQTTSPMKISGYGFTVALPARLGGKS